jgi:WD40 repeat protein
VDLDAAALDRPLLLFTAGPNFVAGMLTGMIPLQGQLLSPLCLARSPDCTLLAVGGVRTPWPFQPNVQEQTGSVLVWDLMGNEVKGLVEVPSQVLALDFSPDGRTLATAGSDRQIRLWDTGGFWPPVAVTRP